ncbi:centrosomal protein of 162 kDa [Drosophila nasuta]|uniref:centrosomal protein of 162 kDa n=1 Tax=Drosophila nasuta TaxID=42062 RepID=UPI00295ED5C4|nr:centrosomal protein of 162 kDa [Drosophila nasuta]
MSKVLSPHKQETVSRQRPQRSCPPRHNSAASVTSAVSVTSMEVVASMDLDALDYTSGSSIIEFLAKEQDCNIEPADPDSIFQEVSRLSDNTDMRSVDELLLEAERLIQQQLRLGGAGDGDATVVASPATAVAPAAAVQLKPCSPSSSSPQSLSSPQNSIRLNTRYTRSIEHVTTKPTFASPKQAKVEQEESPTSATAAAVGVARAQTPQTDGTFVAFVDNLPSESVISEESTPKDMLHHTHNGNGNELLAQQLQLEQLDNTDDDEDTMEEITEAEDCVVLGGQSRRSSGQAAVTTANSSLSGKRSYKPIAPMASYCEKAVGSSPKHLVSTLSSPIEQIGCSVSREHALMHEIEQLQEKLKDTEERLASVRLQSESLSQSQRAMREQNGRLQDESEMLKLDVQHLHECAGVLRSELLSARRDRDEAIQLERSLRTELEEAQQERRQAADVKDKDARIIQDLQRQCREMERILMRKYPDSVSALIVASKNPGICSMNDQENMSSRKLLEQRIAQLESDAKEQDRKAQQILANVQARFNSVQAKYETHIADLETQVLSLQEINTKLNEQIESQVRTLDRYMQKRADRYYNNCTQTEEQETVNWPLGQLATVEAKATATSTATQTPSNGAMRDHSTNTIGCPSPSVICQQHLQQQQQQLHSAGSSSTSSTANSTPNTSRPNSKQSGTQRRIAIGSKLPISQSDSTLSLLSHGQGQGHSTAKEDSQLLSSVRCMRVDLAIKNKAMQRLTRELDECKKTIRKLQRDSGAVASSAAVQRRGHDQGHYQDHVPPTTESQALKEAQNKYHLLEADYKTLHDKRLQDLKTLQSAHERELASCNEAVRILQQRLNEREEAFATQKRRKVPVDYYALKAKVSLLERRHSEREERLHMLVEALSKGRLNGALEDMLQENNNK